MFGASKGVGAKQMHLAAFAVARCNSLTWKAVLGLVQDGMEAVWKIDVENFPAFIVVDNKGNDFFQKWSH